MAVELRCETARGRRYATRMRSEAEMLMCLLGLEGWELSLMMVGDRAIRRLNRRFRKEDRATDVLSFAQLEGRAADGRAPRGQARRPPIAAPAGAAGRPGRVLGDVVVSADTALAQARRLRVAPAARLRTLLIHGLLHLLGYDHERSPAEARRMFARERELDAALTASRRGTGAPHRRARRAAAARAKRR